MRRHLAYLRYVLLHKAFVFYAGTKLKVPLWRLLIHDYSKFLPREWLPYSDYFHGICDYCGQERLKCLAYRDIVREDFDKAWLHHQHSNPHHWQYWLTFDGTTPRALEIPEHFVRELVSDWASAGKCINGTWEFASWYEANKDKMLFHPNTRALVEWYIAVLSARLS